MTLQAMGAAVSRVRSILSRRPEVGIEADSTAHAHWQSGARVVTRHSSGITVTTDMPKELGGSGDQVSPGWLFRAGMASCAATSITLAAAHAGVDLTKVEVKVDSQSDARGVLGVHDAQGNAVYAGPFDVRMQVSVAANAIAPADLENLVRQCLAHSPVPSAVQTATPIALDIHVVPT